MAKRRKRHSSRDFPEPGKGLPPKEAEPRRVEPSAEQPQQSKIVVPPQKQIVVAASPAKQPAPAQSLGGRGPVIPVVLADFSPQKFVGG